MCLLRSLYYWLQAYVWKADRRWDMSETSDLVKTEQTLGKVEELELRIASYNEKIQADNREWPRESEHYQKLLEAVVDLHQEYRKHNDFNKEMRLYNSQQELFAQYDDEREFVPWEMYKGGCCNHYEKKQDALRYLEHAFKLSQAALKKYDLMVGSDLQEQRPAWSMHWIPAYGKGLCRLYMDADRKEDAIGVASTCYTYVRDQVTGFPPVGKAFESSLNNWLLWAEICGRIYMECDQKYMARMVYEMTVKDLKRFNWDSPLTLLPSSQHTLFSNIFKNKLENLGPDSDEDSDEEEEPPVPIQRRLQLAFIKPTKDPDAPIECATSVVDIAKAPPYKALSYAWGNSRKLISYTREDGPPYADDEDNRDSIPVEELIHVDGQTLRIRQTLLYALRQMRQPESEVTVWVDAVCTHPDEMKRRAAWALRMRDIYKHSEEVVAWLGQGDEDTQKAMVFLEGFWNERPKHLGDLGEYLFGPNTCVPWKGICKLLRSEWWKRIWTLQEFLVAKELKIRCGNKSVPWRNLQEFTTFVDLESATYRQSAERGVVLRPMIDLVKERHEYICLRDEYRVQFGFPLEKLWQMTKGHEAYDPRDKIYALLGMLDQPSAKNSPKINYDFCPCAVYTDMIVFRSIGDSEALADGPMAQSRKAGGMILLGHEQGTEKALKHFYNWDFDRVEERCDGEKCGRRLKCFSDGIPEFPSHWEMGRVMEFMTMMYDLHVKMKRPSS